MAETTCTPNSSFTFAPIHLTCEYRQNPVGIDKGRPRLSWQLPLLRRNVRQSAYQVVVASSTEKLLPGAADLWDCGRIESDESIHQPYQGLSLASGQRCYWRVRVWNEMGNVSEWSEIAFWEMGLLETSDWQADWIEPDLELDTDPNIADISPNSLPAPYLRREFTVTAPVKRARLYATSHGLYHIQLNGLPVLYDGAEALFKPGWTSYHNRLQYQTADVTTQLIRGEGIGGDDAPGENALGVILGDGWYRGHMGLPAGQRDFYGTEVALLLQLQIDYENGERQIITSDGEWRASSGPLRFSDIYNGEAYDACLEQPGWSVAGFDDREWHPVRTVDHPKDHLIAQVAPPVRRVEEVRPVRIEPQADGSIIVDFGQNLVGRVRLSVCGETGTTITLGHAEVLDADGSLYTEPLRSARQEVRYTLKGSSEDSPEVYEPVFTFQGFRYVSVEGYAGELSADDLTAIVIHSEMSPSGTFECSEPLLNQLQHNIIWGQKGNFLDVPTDCPQRDERLGWTGDAQIFVRTACFNMDVATFFSKWLGDVTADQGENGAVPHVIPDVLNHPNRKWSRAGSAAWGDAAAICPWTIYLCYGDRDILAQQYESMVAWVEYIRGTGAEEMLWNTGFHFGDWLAIAPEDARMLAPGTEKDLIATAYYAHSTALVATVARILGKDEDAQRYGALREAIVESFRREFVTARGRLVSGTQTAYAVALVFDLLPEELRPVAAQRLAENVRAHENHLTTGFVGTPYLCHALSQTGHLDMAYDLLMQREYPSWLYPISQGATTIWERWDSIRPDGSFQDAGMNSFNHYAYGAIGDWLYRVVAGIDLDAQEPGYKHIHIAPQPGGGLTYARASHQSPYGEVVSAWEMDGDGQFRLTVEVPANSRATVRLPAASLDRISEGGKSLSDGIEGVRSVREEGDVVVVEVGAGAYGFGVAAV